MKKILLILFMPLFSQALSGQTFESTAITKEILQRLTKEVDRDAEAYKQSITTNDNGKAVIAFSVDTFKIEQLAARRSKSDYSTADMMMTIAQMRDSYDKLLNKYYKKLLDLLKPADRDVLIKAQRAWLAFRANEFKLISTLKKAEYSGGGTIQRILANDDELDFIKNRVIVLFNYYSDTINDGALQPVISKEHGD